MGSFRGWMQGNRTTPDGSAAPSFGERGAVGDTSALSAVFGGCQTRSRGDLMPSACNVPSRTIFTGDNLDILRGINSECVDLIYLEWIDETGNMAASASHLAIF